MEYSFTKADDEDLVRRILLAPAVYREFIIRYQRMVSVIISRMIMNEEDRKDISQDVFLKAYHNLSSFRYSSRLSTWLGSITYNTCINFLNKKKYVLFDDLYPEEAGNDGNKFDVPDFNMILQDEWLSSKEVHQQLHHAIEQLPPVFKTMISLYHSEEICYEEIGEIMGLPIGTVKSYLFRARKKLKESLLMQYKTEEP